MLLQKLEKIQKIATNIMARKSLYSQNKEKILNRFKSAPYYFSNKQIVKILNKLKDNSLLSESISFDALLKSLINEGFYSYSLKIKDVYYTRYTFIKKINPIRFAATLGGPSPFLSMTSALNFQGLTNYREDFIFVSNELSKKDSAEVTLKQEAVDNAFRKGKTRYSTTIGAMDEKKIILLSPKFSNNLEIIKYKDLRVSTVNRAFVEMMINVHYFRSSENIINIYKPLKDKLDLNRIYEIIDKLDYIYPYFQCAGFYLEQIGFEKNELCLFKERVSKLNFYAQKGKESYVYNTYWKMYY